MGVIASLTIPSLIQNTHKKEEQVKAKKALSVINQALATNYALTEKYLSDYTSSEQMVDMLKKRLVATSASTTDETPFYVRTQDGWAYIFWGTNNEYDSSREIKPENAYLEVYVATQPNNEDTGMGVLGNHCMTVSSLGNLTGCFVFYCGYDRCVPSPGTAAIINASDPTKAE